MIEISKRLTAVVEYQNRVLKDEIVNKKELCASQVAAQKSQEIARAVERLIKLNGNVII